MTRPWSPRTEAVLCAVHAAPLGTGVDDVVAALDLDPPDGAWTELSDSQRRDTVRRYMVRLTEAGELSRWEDGVYVRTPTYAVEGVDPSLSEW